MAKRYSEDHEWVSLAGKEATVGISAYAQGQLGDVVFVEVPEVGRKLAKGEAAAVVESVKAASDVYSPATGTVSAVNAALAEDPAKVNADAEGEGWFYKMTLADPKELDALMDEAAYKTFVEGLA
jgi:glycine cleavage system H protein